MTSRGPLLSQQQSISHRKITISTHSTPGVLTPLPKCTRHTSPPSLLVTGHPPEQSSSQVGGTAPYAYGGRVAVRNPRCTTRSACNACLQPPSPPTRASSFPARTTAI